MKSIFSDKDKQPQDADLKKALGDTYPLWKLITNHVLENYPAGLNEWSFSSTGWSYRMKDKKRVIIYLLPRDKFFKVAFVFGQKATDAIRKSNVAPSIKAELEAAKVYAEGRGIRIEVKEKAIVPDIQELIDHKLAS